MELVRLDLPRRVFTLSQVRLREGCAAGHALAPDVLAGGDITKGACGWV